MSVVNQMLRDLDARRTAGQPPRIDAGVAPVRPRPVAPPWAARSAAAAGAMALIGAGVLATGGWASADAPVAVATAAPAAEAARPGPLPAPRPVTVAVAAPIVQAEPAKPVAMPAAEPVAPPARSTTATHAASAALPPSPKPTRVALAVPVARATAPKAGMAPAPAPAGAASAATPAAVAASTPLPAKQFALVDRVPAARELWSAGQGEAAIALLREALAAPHADAPGRAAAARELARLELLARDPDAALRTLDRHAADLRGDAQAWALRGNAAQRLGRHDDAVAAFESAVRLHGEDTRSMLGAAVSLAAAGDTARARQWAERARMAGGIPSDVLAYLGRLGVTLER